MKRIVLVIMQLCIVVFCLRFSPVVVADNSTNPYQENLNYLKLSNATFMTDLINNLSVDNITFLEDGSIEVALPTYETTPNDGTAPRFFSINLIYSSINDEVFDYTTPNHTSISGNSVIRQGAYIKEGTFSEGEDKSIYFCLDYPNEIAEDLQRGYSKLYGDNSNSFENIRVASLRYNCHSYAWYSQGQLNNVWMNSPEIYYSSNDGSYRALGVDEEPRIGDLVVYMKESNYPNHSGIISGYSDDTANGVLGNVNRYMVDSKWGDAGLYRHKGDYCPYYTSATSIVYFRLNTDDQTAMSHTNTFYHDNVTIQAKSSNVSRNNTVYACELNFTYSGNHNITITSDVVLNTTLWNVWRENYGLTCNEVINEEGQYIYTYSGLFDAGYYYLRAECENEDDSANISVSVSQHEHAYINYTDLGDGTHKNYCDCGGFRVDNHEYECSDDENGTSHTYTCSCGISINEEHDYELVSKNSTHHTYACSCGSSFTNAHTYVKSNYSSTQHKMTCPCGNIKYEDHDYCTYTDYSSSNHKSSCDCGAYIYQLHVIKSDSGIGRYLPCTFCGRMIDTEDGGIKIPIIHNKFENEESE